MIKFSTPLKYNHCYSQDELATMGIQGWPFAMARRVEYAELDTVNHANNTAYFKWFEAARYHYMTMWGLPDDPPGPTRVIRSTSATFHRELLMGQDFLVTARTRAFRNTSFTMEYNILTPDLHATGEAVVVLLHPDGSSRYPLRDTLKARFQLIDDATAE